MILNSHATLHRTQLQKQLDDIPTRFERCAQTIRRTSSFGVQARPCSPRRGPVPFNLCRVSRVIAPVPKRQYQTRKGIFANPNEAHEPEKATFPHSPSPPSPDRPTPSKQKTQRPGAEKTTVREDASNVLTHPLPNLGLHVPADPVPWKVWLWPLPSTERAHREWVSSFADKHGNVLTKTSQASSRNIAY